MEMGITAFGGLLHIEIINRPRVGSIERLEKGDKTVDNAIKLQFKLIRVEASRSTSGERQERALKIVREDVIRKVSDEIKQFFMIARSTARFRRKRDFVTEIVAKHQTGLLGTFQPSFLEFLEKLCWLEAFRVESRESGHIEETLKRDTTLRIKIARTRRITIEKSIARRTREMKPPITNRRSWLERTPIRQAWPNTGVVVSYQIQLSKRDMGLSTLKRC